ncbi:GMC family oxidoreductase N-terminal domain-containing protein [Leucobacter sp. USHLN153]|uniref:GMC family oxidoreductase N-terminal domain-containing protein n=1 Tax=Leucobacter sp. USHLN153 TaxID=3081268 RepID=UPI003015D3B2
MSTREAASPIRTLVVGGGGAGAPLAARLCTDPGREVILIEAGPASARTPAELLDGGSLSGAHPEHSANWAYPATLRKGRDALVARGRILGGSTAINGGYFVRATPSDFSNWARIGGRAWSYERALPILRDLENDLDLGSSPLHGSSGPVRVARTSQAGDAQRLFHAAAKELGFRDEPDKNAGTAPGVGPVPSNIVAGARINSAEAYLEGVRDRLDVRGDTRAMRVVFETSKIGGPPRAIGVETNRGFIEADEVVLACGGIATPQVLMLSGIGPSTHLHSIGIPVVADLPVGTAFQDHPNVPLEWRTADLVVDGEAGYGFPTALNFNSADADPSLSPRPDGDIEILLAAKPLGALVAGARHDSGTLDVLVALQEHTGRGRITLASEDPLVPPRIEYHYLERDDDRARMRAAVRTAARLLRSRAMASAFAGFTTLDDHALGDDGSLDEWIFDHLGTALHTSASAPMGDVVDGFGRVHGVSGLLVADLSILPTTPHRGPANTAIFIGEFMARHLLHSGE